jgi:rare lipoprotein A
MGHRTGSLRGGRVAAERPDGAVLLGGALAVALLLGGCGSTPEQADTTPGGPPDAVPKVEPKSKLGNMHSYVVFGKTYYTKASSRGYVERGIASWYGPKFHGRKTSSGEPYDMHQMTAAHKTLPLPTYALVRNLENGRSAIVKINDRGPFVGDRIIDLSYAAAKKLGVDQKGTAHVEIVSIDPRDHGGKVPKQRLTAATRESIVSSQRGATPAVRQASRSVAEPGPAAADVSAWSTKPRPAPEHRSKPTATATATAIAAAQPAPASVTAAERVQRAEPASALQPAPGPASASGSARTADTMPPQPAVVAASGAPLYLQVGAFGTRSNAEQLRRRLQGLLQDPVAVQEAAAGGAGLYKVQVGPVASQADAAVLSEELMRLGVGRPIVVD